MLLIRHAPKIHKCTAIRTSLHIKVVRLDRLRHLLVERKEDELPFPLLRNIAMGRPLEIVIAARRTQSLLRQLRSTQIIDRKLFTVSVN